MDVGDLFCGFPAGTDGEREFGNSGVCYLR